VALDIILNLQDLSSEVTTLETFCILELVQIDNNRYMSIVVPNVIHTYIYGDPVIALITLSRLCCAPVLIKSQSDPRHRANSQRRVIISAYTQHKQHSADWNVLVHCPVSCGRRLRDQSVSCQSLLLSLQVVVRDPSC
jgi:hypothetical protein